MKVLNDFWCASCASTEEYFVENDLTTTACQVCGQDATKVISPIRFQLEGVSGDFPTAADRWVKRREEKIAQEKIHNP
jgi:rRNA maturation protein Nop10